MNFKAITILLLLSTSTLSAMEQITISNREARLERRLDKIRQSRGVESPTIVVAEPPVEREVTDSINQVERIAQHEIVAPPKRDSGSIEFNPRQIDSLLGLWSEVESQSYFDNFFNQYICLDVNRDDSTPQPIDSIYRDRLLNLASPVELPYNSIVRSYINRYTSQSSKLMSNIVTRSQLFFPSIEEKLINAGLPVELRAMAIVESALNTTAVSRAGAAGLWQFMPSTGAMYGLEINSLVDDRCDPEKATIAACRFLADLYKMYNDWGLAIAAYNCGPGNVNKALARSGLKQGSFWDIYDYLPTETRGYLPAFIGASYGYAYHREHDITPVAQSLPLATDTIQIDKILHLGQVAEVLELPLDILKRLNPQYRKDIIPATTKSYSLTLPQQYISAYIESEEAIHALDSKYLKEYINPANIEKLRKVPHNRIHTVRSGDTLSGIASKYRVTTRQLISWNNLKNANKLSIGQKLKVSN